MNSLTLCVLCVSCTQFFCYLKVLKVLRWPWHGYLVVVLVARLLDGKVVCGITELLAGRWGDSFVSVHRILVALRTLETVLDVSSIGLVWCWYLGASAWVQVHTLSMAIVPCTMARLINAIVAYVMDRHYSWCVGGGVAGRRARAGSLLKSCVCCVVAFIDWLIAAGCGCPTLCRHCTCKSIKRINQEGRDVGRAADVQPWNVSLSCHVWMDGCSWPFTQLLLIILKVDGYLSQTWLPAFTPILVLLGE